MTWRLIDTPPAPGALNMGVDEALMDSVRAGGAPILRFYRWSPACLSLGRNQPAAGWYLAADLAVRGVEVVRRLSGGRAVLHADELTYAAVLPERALGSARRAYRAINEALASALLALGVPANLKPEGARRSPGPTHAPCFAEPVAGELTAGGVKLVGSAQLRVKGVLLQHGSLPLRDGSLSIEDLAPGSAEAPGHSIVLERFLSPLPAWEELTATLARVWGERLGSLERSTLREKETARAAALAQRYRDPEWTWRA